LVLIELQFQLFGLIRQHANPLEFILTAIVKFLLEY
jgi:hypothetical protein